jgi:capsule polysaccharide export protein KpsE/RkpR
MPPDGDSSIATKLASLGGAAVMGPFSDMFSLHTTGAQFINILESRTVLDQIITDLDLRRAYGVTRLNDARSLLASSTNISEDRKSGVITLTITDRDPQRANAIAAAYVEGLNRLVSGLNTSAAHRERVFIEERLKVVKRDLDDAAKQLSEFSSKSAMLNIQEQGRVMLSSAAALQEQIVAAESELRGLEQVYTTNNTRVRVLRAKVEELKRELNKLSGQPGEPNESLAQGGNSSYPSIRDLPRLGVTYQELSQRVRIQEGVYEALTKQYEMSKVEEAKEIPSVRLLDPPNLPEQKSGPARRMIIYLGTLISFVLGSAWVVFVSAWERIRPDDPRRVLAQEVSQRLLGETDSVSADQVAGGTFATRVWRRYIGRNGNQHKSS